MNLIVTVNTPKDGETITTSPITVSGTLNKHGTVKINDIQLPGEVASFSTQVELTKGANTITIVAAAVDPDQTVTKTVTVNFAP